MKKIVIPRECIETISIEAIDGNDIVFIGYNDKKYEDKAMVGMIIYEDRGWIGRNGLCKDTHLTKLSGHYDSKIECIKHLISQGYGCYTAGR